MTGQRPRVAVLADWWWPQTVGGAERSARSVAHTLAGFAEVTVFVPAAEEQVYQDGPLTVRALRRPFARRAHADTRLRQALEFLTAWLLPTVARRIGRHLDAYAPDVVVAHNVSRTGPWLLARVRRRGLPFVRVYHDLSDTCWRRSRFKGGRVCADVCGACRLKTGVLRRATPPRAASVCVSGFVREQLAAAALTTPAASTVGYPLRDVAPRPIPPRAGDGTVLGYIGRLDPTKGIESAVRAAAAFRRRTGRAVSLLIAGEGQPAYVAALAELAARESLDVELAGHLEIDAFCARVDAVLIPSAWPEPFGRVAVEVGVRGRPMLVAASGGLPEAASLSGGRYAFADFRDPDAAADALAALLDGTPAVAAPAVRRADPAALPLPEAVAATVRRLVDSARAERR